MALLFCQQKATDVSIGCGRDGEAVDWAQIETLGPVVTGDPPKEKWNADVKLS